jgi:CRP-like cAMP-binding protein
VSTQTDLLRRIDFFEPLDQKIITKVAQACIEREYSKGECIVRQGESGLGLFFITSGRVNVEVERNGIKAVVATLQTDDLLGELSIIDNKPRSANVICLEDTRCLLLTRDSFSKLLNKYPEIAIHMAKALAGRIRAADERMSRAPAAAQAAEVAAAPSAEVQAQATPSAAAGPDKIPADGASTDASAKNKVKDFLVDTFSFLYVAKALTRFSAAIVGCPVEIRVADPGPKVAQVVIDGVKVALFSASEDRTILIEAYDQGEFSATVLRPPDDLSEIRVSHLQGRVQRDARMFLHVPRDGPACILEVPRKIASW